MTDTVLTLWVLIGSAMILFMHSGFAMIEAGFVRVKNVGTVMINNLTDFAICGLIFWAFGMGFMFNGDSEDSQFISLGFTPKFVLVMADGTTTKDGSTYVYGGMAITGRSSAGIATTGNGFIVYESGNTHCNFYSSASGKGAFARV